MFANIVGYTAMIQQDEMAGFVNVKRYRKELARLVDQYGGEILQHYGDGNLATLGWIAGGKHLQWLVGIYA